MSVGILLVALVCLYGTVVLRSGYDCERTDKLVVQLAFCFVIDTIIWPA